MMRVESVSNYAVDVLKVHPQNTDFFDDISGVEYESFKKSISNEGVITPILIAPDMTIISGHQRVKACQDLGIKLIPAIMRDALIDEDEKLKILLASNFGRLKNNPMKQSRVISEYEKLCGVKEGRPSKKLPNNSAVTQSDIAKQLGVSVDTLQNLKKLQNLHPELQDLVESGDLKATTAYKVWAKLSESEQKLFLDKLGASKVSSMSGSDTQSEIDKLIDEKHKLELEKRQWYEKAQNYKKEANCKEEEIDELKRSITEEKESLSKENARKLKKRIKQLEGELMDAKIEIQRGITLKDYNFDVFRDVCDNFISYSSNYEYLDYKYEEMGIEELQDFIIAAEDVEQSILNIKNLIGELINAKQC